jgi:hypothetical protein
MKHEWRSGIVRPALDGQICGALGIFAMGAAWSVTHLPSGRAIGWAVSEFDAVAFVEAVIDLADWSAIEHGKTPAGLRAKVRAAMARHRTYRSYHEAVRAVADADDQFAEAEVP